MSIFQLNGVCPAILVGIEQILAPNNPGNMKTPVGAIEALLSDVNTQGVTMQQIGGGENGNRKQVRVMHKQRATPADVRDEKTCDPGTEKPRFEDVYDVNLQAEHVIHVEEATIRRLCDTYSELVAIDMKSKDAEARASEKKLILREMAEELLMDLDAIRQKINANFLSAYALNVGTYKGGDATKTFQVLKQADQAIVLNGFNILRQELKKIGMMGGKPIVFGGGIIDLAMSAMGIGCCNNAGQSIDQLKNNVGFDFYFDDSDMATYLGNANAFGMFYAKAAQFIQFNKYVGSYAKPIGFTERGTMPDPFLPGLVYDIRIQPNACGEYYDLFVNSDHDFYFAPDNLFKSGDRLAGVNGVFKAIAAYTA